MDILGVDKIKIFVYDMDTLLNTIYYKEHNYDGVDQLYQKAKKRDKNITKAFVSEWLSKQQSRQQTHKTVGKKVSLPIYSETPYAFQFDLTFFPRYKTKNDGNYVLFTAINVNTRYAYAYYAKNKEMNTILDMLKDMEKKTVINSISCDEGLEFNNSEFIDFCEENNIELYVIKADGHKLGIINRFHRTIKEKLTKYFTANDTVRWIDVIVKIIYNYNHTINRGIGIEPNIVNSLIEHEFVMRNKYITDKIHDNKDTISVGDKVRILNKRNMFEDKMLSRYSSTVFTVTKVTRNSCEIEDETGNELTVKNSQLLKVRIEKNNDLKGIKKVGQEAKAASRIKRSGLDVNNIVENSTRERRPNMRYT